MGALDLNANRGRFGYDAQPRWGVSADKLSFSDSDKQANCLGECDRCNKLKKKRKRKTEKSMLAIANYMEFLLIFSNHFSGEKWQQKSKEEKEER